MTRSKSTTCGSWCIQPRATSTVMKVLLHSLLKSFLSWSSLKSFYVVFPWLDVHFCCCWQVLGLDERLNAKFVDHVVRYEERVYEPLVDSLMEVLEVVLLCCLSTLYNTLQIFLSYVVVLLLAEEVHNSDHLPCDVLNTDHDVSQLPIMHTCRLL